MIIYFGTTDWSFIILRERRLVTYGVAELQSHNLHRFIIACNITSVIEEQLPCYM